MASYCRHSTTSPTSTCQRPGFRPGRLSTSTTPRSSIRLVSAAPTSASSSAIDKEHKTMAQRTSSETEILDVLWQSLKGGNYDLEAMKAKVHPDSRFDELGIDSLDMTDFFIRIED